jgi:hypothetical protein
MGLNASPGLPHLLDKILGQSPLLEGPQNAIDRQQQLLPSLKRLSPEQAFYMTE